MFESQEPSNNKQEVMLSPVIKPNFGINKISKKNKSINK